jgi:hypothetical protein
MAIQKKAARQMSIEAFIDINWADPVAYGVAENGFEVPAGAILTGGDLTVITAWNSATSADLTLGDVNVANRYAAAINLKVAARTALTVTGYKHTIQEFLKVLLAQVGAPATAGQARLRITYIVDGRAAFGQGVGA